MSNVLNSLSGRVRVLAERMKSGEALPHQQGMELLFACSDTIDALHKQNTYLEDSLTAATCGELPERFDLNQLLLARRAKSYIKWLNETKDANDKLRPEGSNGTP